MSTTMYPALLKLSFPYVVDHVPVTSPKRKGDGKSKDVGNNPMNWEYITIHNTGNTASTAKNERAWLTNPSNKSVTGYHIVVDNAGAIEGIPFGENAWHAGDGNGTGNRKSIGIELCETGDIMTTIKHAVEICTVLLKAKNKGIDSIRQHHDWSGKECPRILRANNGKLWNVFISLLKESLTKTTKPGTVVVPAPPVPAKPVTGHVETITAAATVKNINGSLLIPARAFMDAIDGEVAYYDADTKSVVLDYKDKLVTLTDGLATLEVRTGTNPGPVLIPMPTAAKIIDGSFHVLGRALVEAIGGKVAWDEPTHTATFTVGNKAVKAKVDSNQLIVQTL